MLVLSREVGEDTVLKISPEAVRRLAEENQGVEITIALVRTSGQRVRLGFAAPRDVDITRPEAIHKASRLPERTSIKS